MRSPYQTLGIVLAINTIIMFLLTFALIARPEHFYPNINRLYMALMMVAPMGILMLIAMRAMFENSSLNRVVMIGFAALFALSFTLARTQTPVGNEQFLRSMIPHHSSAILMCQQSSITDAEILTLCEQIVRTQEEEIAQMLRILARN